MQQSKDLYEGRVPTLTPLRQYVTGATTRLPIILMAAVMFVLLIAVSNVANLMLGQASERAQEIAVRFSVGASRWRVIRQLLTESLLLAIVSGALGLLCVGLLTGTVSALLPEDVPRIHPIHIDWRVATFAATVSVLSGALFGLYPAFNASRQSFSESLKQGKQIRLGDLSGRSVRAALTIAEVALAMILCVGAGLLSKSFLAYLRVDVGVNPKNAVMLQIPGPVAEWKDSIETRMARYRNLIDSVASVPGVGEAAMSSNVPMIMRAAAFGNRVSIDEHPISPGKLAHIQMFLITPRYFSIMGSPILHGRAFTDSDNTAGPPVAIIAEATARQFWPGRDPIGKSMTTKNGLAARTYTVVGVVRDVKKTEYEENITKTFGVDGVVYLPLFGEPGAPPPPSRFLIFRSAVDPHAVLADVRQAVLRADSKQAIRQIDFFNDVLEKDLGAPRFRAFLVGSFAGIALLIAVIGIYGVVSHTVASRLHEMGVRMVMGARGSDILRLVVGQGILLVLTGILLGIAGSFALTRLIESFLFRTEAFDGATFTAVSLIFALVALIACVLPARRAANADPISVLRCE
jgi:putative ABC transport system permease protein